MGKRFRDLLNVAGSIFYETHFAPLLRMQGFFYEVALDLSTADGQTLPVLANAAERRDAAGNLLFTRVTLFQAKDRRRYERGLVNAQEAERKARRQLEELNATLEKRIAEQVEERMRERKTAKLREQFIAVLGHDLRNPLAAINAGISRVERDGWTEQTPRILWLMRDSVTRMSRLIDNVLDLARARLGDGIVLQLDDNQPLRPTLELVVEEIRTANPQRVIAFHTDLYRPVRVDHARIAQMLSNLLGNAVAHGAEDVPIQVRAALAADELVLSVANGGDPIPPEMMDQLFKPFHRGHVRENAKGLGLGLYIASQIAEAHGGTLDVKSNARKTCFTFRMPTMS